MKLKFILYLLIFSVTPVIFAQKSTGNSPFKNQPLAEAINTEIENSKVKTDFVIDARQVKSKSSVIYTGETRNVSEKKLSYLKLWAESQGNPEVVDHFKVEARFREGDKDYWLPIWNRLLTVMEKQVKKGDKVIIYTILTGGVMQDKKLEWIFIAGNFSK